MHSEQGSRLTLTVLEVAALLRISRGSCYEAIHAGQIPSLRFGRSIRIPRYALEQLLNAQYASTNLQEIADARSI